MPKQTYPIERNGPKRLEVSWGRSWKNMTIRLDGTAIGTIPGQKELSAGQEFSLPDGSTLKVQLIKNFFAGLHILRNDQPLPGSAGDPHTKLKGAYRTTYFIGGFNLFLGLATMIFEIRLLQMSGIGVFNIVFGVIFLILGYFVQRKSVISLFVAIVLFALRRSPDSCRSNCAGKFLRHCRLDFPYLASGSNDPGS